MLRSTKTFYALTSGLILVGITFLLLNNQRAFETESMHEKPIFSEFMGINTHNVEVNMNLLAPVFNLVRDYHTVTWSLPDNETRRANFPYSNMEIGWHDRSGKVGHHEGLVNFEKIYESWVSLGFDINASLMMVQKHPSNWTHLEEDAYHFGKDFASYFGPSNRGLVSSVEVGNEPVPYWDLESYAKAFQSMARGIRDGDPAMKILTAAAQPGKPDEFSVPLDMYKEFGDLYDVIKIHVYAFKQLWPTFERSFPEDPSINNLRIIENTIRWRDRHAPGKEIWITEFGYDSSHQSPEPGSDWAQLAVVSDFVQAQWLIRSLLEFSRLDVQRAYIYWFNDHDEFAFHASSGIMRLNRPKMSYWALKQMQQVLGEFRFSEEVQRRRGNIHLYAFEHGGNPNKNIWVAWSPTGETHRRGSNRTLATTIDVPSRPVKVIPMQTTEQTPNSVSFEYHNGRLTFELSESPVYIVF